MSAIDWSSETQCGGCNGSGKESAFLRPRFGTREVEARVMLLEIAIGEAEDLQGPAKTVWARLHHFEGGPEQGMRQRGANRVGGQPDRARSAAPRTHAATIDLNGADHGTVGIDAAGSAGAVEAG